jgi:MFS family permease
MYDSRVSNRLLTILFITQSLFSASQISIITLQSIAAGVLAGTTTAAGMPSTVTTFTQSIMAYFFGIYMGRYGRRMGLTTAYSFGMVSAIIGVISIYYGIYPLLLVSSAGMGMARAGADMSRFVAGELYPEQLRARMIGRIVFAGTIGAILGPALVGPSGQLATLLDLNPNSSILLANSQFMQSVMPIADFSRGLTTGPWLIATFMYGLSVLITFLFLRPDPSIIAKQHNGKKDKVGDSTTSRPLKELLRLPNVQLAIIAMLISQTVMVTLMTITPWHMHQAGHLNTDVSLVIAAHTLGMFGLSALTGYLIDRYGRVQMMIIGGLTLIVAAIISPLSTQLPYLVVGLFLLGLGWNFGYIAGSSMLADALRDKERSRVQGFNDMLVAFAAGLGTLSSGFLFEFGGYLLVSIGGGLLTLILMVLIRQLSSKQVQLKTV